MANKNEMKSLRMTSTGTSAPTLGLTTVSKPTLAPNTVLVKIHASGINPSDVLNASGGFHDTSFPRTPGRDYSGVVEEGPEDLIGKAVYGTSGSALGFQVDGTHAEYCLVSTDAIALKPSNLSFAQAAVIGVPFTTAALTLRRAQLQPNDVVLVTGANGAVGSTVCQLAKNHGCRVLTAARNDRADVNLLTDPEMKTAKDLTDGKGPNVMVDATGSPALVAAGLMILAPRGRLSYISAPKKGSTDLTFDMKHVYREEISLIGCNSVSTPPQETATELEEMRAGFESGSIKAEGDDHLEKITIEEAVEAYDTIKNGTHKKFVIMF